MIFPLKEKVVIKRKVGNDIKTASIGIDFDHMKFYVTEGSKTTDIKSFNEYLICACFYCSSSSSRANAGQPSLRSTLPTSSWSEQLLDTRGQLMSLHPPARVSLALASSPREPPRARQRCRFAPVIRTSSLRS